MKTNLIANRIKIAKLIGTYLLFTACAADSPLGILLSPPECQIISFTENDREPGHFARIVMTVQNTGSKSTAYNVGCEIKLKRGNTIIDRSGAGFGTLRPGEAAIDEAWFTRIEKHSEYDRAKITLFWYDAEGGYYEK